MIEFLLPLPLTCSINLSDSCVAILSSSIDVNIIVKISPPVDSRVPPPAASVKSEIVTPPFLFVFNNLCKTFKYFLGNGNGFGNASSISSNDI